MKKPDRKTAEAIVFLLFLFVMYYLIFLEYAVICYFKLCEGL